MNTSEFHSVIDRACRRFAGSVTSGHRTAKHNSIVVGAPNSQHLGFRAVDIVLDDWRNKEMFILWLRERGLFVLDEVDTKNHVHVDDRNDI